MSRTRPTGDRGRYPQGTAPTRDSTSNYWILQTSALGYDWHDIMNMIAAVVSDDLYRAVHEHRHFDPGDYARRLNELPGDWPPPQAPGSN